MEWAGIIGQMETSFMVNGQINEEMVKEHSI